MHVDERLKQLVERPVLVAAESQVVDCAAQLLADAFECRVEGRQPGGGVGLVRHRPCAASKHQRLGEVAERLIVQVPRDPAALVLQYLGQSLLSLAALNRGGEDVRDCLHDADVVTGEGVVPT